MKIVLIALPLNLGKRYTKFGGIQYPINLGYLASYLIKHNYQVQMWDYNVEQFTEQGFAKRVKETSPDIIGIHCKTPTILIGSKFARIIKKVNPKIKVVIGGPHSTALPERTLQGFPEFDICVIAEGELTFLELCNKIKEKIPLKGTLGIAYRNKKEIVIEPRRPLIKNLDDIPFPNRDLINLKKYNTAHVERGIPRNVWTIAEIMVSRGCPFQCTYCAGSLNYGNIVRFRSAKNVIKEVEECVKKYNINYVNVNDDTITLRKNLLYDLCDGFKKLGIKWGCLSRVDVITKYMLQKMADSGCIRINFGVESGSDRILKLIKKNTTTEQIKRAFKLAHEVGFKIIDASFMVGQHPDETLKDVKMTVNIMKKIKPTFASVPITVPFPGTKLSSLMKERGYLRKENWENFAMFGKKPEWRTKYFSSTDLVKLQKWVIRKYYLRLNYLIPRLLEIRGVGELKYYIKMGIDFMKNVILKRSSAT